MRETSTLVTSLRHIKLLLLYIKDKGILRQTSGDVGYCYVQRTLLYMYKG